MLNTCLRAEVWCRLFVVSADNWNGLEDYSDGSLYQGDQIGRIFDYWLIGNFLNLHKYPKIWATFFKD
jgi:hypothetical protein